MFLSTQLDIWEAEELTMLTKLFQMPPMGQLYNW